MVIKVTQNDGGAFTATDENGNDVTNVVPRRVMKNAVSTTGFMLATTTKTGKPRWKTVDFSDVSHLFQSAMPVHELGNNNNEMHDDIVQFINNSASLIPEHLVISELKWRYLIRSILRGKNVLMTGPSGCGKTLVAQKLSEVFNDRPYFYFNLGATTDARSTLIGNTHFNKNDGTFVSNALFVSAIQTPNAIILLDEFSRAHHDAVNILMTVLDQNQKYLRIDEAPDTPTISVAAGVTFIATANVGSEYTATRIVDRAILDRFQIIEMEPLTYTQEFDLLTTKFPSVDEWNLSAIAEIADHTRKNVKSDDPKISTIVSTRQTVEMTSLLYDGFTLEEAAEVCIYPFYSNSGGIDSERTYMKQLLQKYVKIDSSAPF